MKIIVFGATGKTGMDVVTQALEQNHLVTAFIRNPDRMSIKHDNLTLITGDALNLENVSQGVIGQDAVICTLGSGKNLKQTKIRSKGTANIIDAMKQHKLKRLIVMTAMGVGESWNDLSLINKFFFAVLMKSIRQDHELQETYVKESKLDWTIIRPSGLTDSVPTGMYKVGERIKAKTSQISRADVAGLILNEINKNDNLHKAITITN
ncbi:MAG: SDR family oxidoreductase [Spirochaetaceae bacterium]